MSCSVGQSQPQLLTQLALGSMHGCWGTGGHAQVTELLKDWEYFLLFMISLNMLPLVLRMC